MTNDYVVITATSTHRMRYVIHKEDLIKMNTDVVPTDLDLIDWAKDCVTMQECEEFSQEWLGEQIVDANILDEEAVLSLFDSDNDYLKDWDRDYKLAYIRKGLIDNQADQYQEPYHEYISRMYKKTNLKGEQNG